MGEEAGVGCAELRPGFLGGGRQIPRPGRDTKGFRYLLDVLGLEHAYVHERSAVMGDHRPQVPLHTLRNAECGQSFT
ncbi:hypothetical protein [Streptomyces ureilyticus]|uniref:Uncharacterized protein n=1 Tax=Streptomyces ureilyticus TaxID=1775131 RepID=A0ABX0DP63_9ACTN|nr:hypothetical protein [Streptomyces ureilyticus]NGO40951.1 hypothetical protein [Streptomyces ureilyticus]